MDSTTIFLASNRNAFKSQNGISKSTLNNSPYSTIKSSIGNLFLLTDEVIFANSEITYTIEENGNYLIIPVHQAIRIHIPGKEETQSYVGGIATYFLQKGEKLQINNTYNSESNYLIIGLNSNNNTINNNNFDIVAINNLNKLYPFLSLGIFKGREQATYIPNSNTTFTYIINGAFEVEDRLLENRDGLCLENYKEINFESLSENAVILFLDI